MAAPHKSSPSSTAISNTPSPAWTASKTRRLIGGRANNGGLWRLDGHIVAIATGRTIALLHGLEEVAIHKPLKSLPRRPRTAPPTTLHLGASSTSDDGNGGGGAVSSGSEGEGVWTIGRGDVKGEATATHEAELFVRQSVFYAHADSGERMTAFRYRPTTRARRVSPVLQPATLVRLSLYDDGHLHLSRAARRAGDVAQGEKGDGGGGEGKDVEGGSTTVRVGTALSAPKALGVGGRAMLSASWTHVGRRVRSLSSGGSGGGGGGGVPGSVERCDYVLGVGGGEGVWHWTRVGRCPAWYGRGQCVTYVTGRKVGRWGEAMPVHEWMEDVGRGRMGARERLEAVERQAVSGGGAGSGVGMQDSSLVAKGMQESGGVGGAGAAGDDGDRAGSGGPRRRRRRWFFGLW